jgi:hydroxymethylbilane synthase
MRVMIVTPQSTAPHATPRRSLPLRVGTRGSPLARVQTETFLGLLRQFCPVLRGMEVFEEHVIETTGDAVQDRALAEIGGKGLFAKEIHEALAAGQIDFAVHSLKDLETVLPDEIVLACTLKREDARDYLILPPGLPAPDPAEPWGALPAEAITAPASVRRMAQLRHARPDVRFVLIRGNVGTRLRKLGAGAADATMLAAAGLKRLGLTVNGAPISPEIMVPSAAQGIVGITVRRADEALRALLSGIEDREAFAVATAERALLAALDGSCRTPIGGYARLLPDGQLHLTGLVARVDGSFLLRRSLVGATGDAQALGRELGDSLRADSPDDIFAP